MIKKLLYHLFEENLNNMKFHQYYFHIMNLHKIDILEKNIE